MSGFEPIPFQGGASASLVTLRGSEPVTTSLAIAQGTENDHASVILMVRKYSSHLDEFGEVRFEIEPGYHNAPVEFAVLNEDQAMLVISFSRNSPIVRQFKKRLIHAFRALAEVCILNPSTPKGSVSAEPFIAFTSGR